MQKLKIVLGMSLATTMGIALPSVSNAQAKCTASATTITSTVTTAPTTAATSTTATSTTASAGDDIQKFVAAGLQGVKPCSTTGQAPANPRQTGRDD